MSQQTCTRTGCVKGAFRVQTTEPLNRPSPSEPEVEGHLVNPRSNRGTRLSWRANRHFLRLQGRACRQTLGVASARFSWRTRVHRAPERKPSSGDLHHGAYGAGSPGTHRVPSAFFSAAWPMARPWSPSWPSRSTRGPDATPRTLPAASGDVIAGGSTTDALSNLPRSTPWPCPRAPNQGRGSRQLCGAGVRVPFPRTHAPTTVGRACPHFGAPARLA